MGLLGGMTRLAVLSLNVAFVGGLVLGGTTTTARIPTPNGTGGSTVTKGCHTTPTIPAITTTM